MMKNILNESYILKWKTTDTYKTIKRKIMSNLILVSKETISKYGTTDINPFYISKSLFVNQELVDILNSLQLRSASYGSYDIINEYNKSLPIQWDESNKKYIIKAGFDKHPVTGISWGGATFISNLFGARLPYEKEWEIAATSGNSNYIYSWGNDIPNKALGNYEENVGSTSEVNSYPPNELGIYDMCGNVEEWCMDSATLCDNVISNHEKIIKGGCWYKSAENMKCSSKRSRWSKIGATGIGFRLIFEEGGIVI